MLWLCGEIRADWGISRPTHIVSESKPNTCNTRTATGIVGIKVSPHLFKQMRGAAIYHLSHDIFVHSDWTNGSATPCMAKIITSLSFSAIMANPRKFSEKIALHNQKQAEETAAFEAIMKEVNSATRTVSAVFRRFTPLSVEEASPSVYFSQGRLLLILSLFAPVMHSRSCMPNITCQSPQALVPVTEEDHYRTSTRSVLIKASTYR